CGDPCARVPAAGKPVPPAAVETVPVAEVLADRRTLAEQGVLRDVHGAMPRSGGDISRSVAEPAVDRAIGHPRPPRTRHRAGPRARASSRPGRTGAGAYGRPGRTCARASFADRPSVPAAAEYRPAARPRRRLRGWVCATDGAPFGTSDVNSPCGLVRRPILN